MSYIHEHSNLTLGFVLLFQGTPGTYLPSHTVYGPEGTKSTVGSISLGLPRQQDPNKPGRTANTLLHRIVVAEF